MLPIILLVILFALANPSPTEIILSPFSDPIKLPLYFIVVFFLCLGFLIGALISWVGMFPGWKEKRNLKKENIKLEKDLNKANEKLIEELSKEKSDPYTRLPDDS
jgi:uncharacterized integral membrane protein